MGDTWATKKGFERRQILAHLKPEKIECVLSVYSSGAPVTEIPGKCGIPLMSVIYDIIDAARLPRRRGYYKRKYVDLSWTSIARIITGELSLYQAYIEKKISGETYKKLRILLKSIKPEMKKLLRLAGTLLDAYMKPIKWKIDVISSLSIEEIKGLEQATAILLFSVPKASRRRFFKKFSHRKRIATTWKRGRLSKEEAEARKELVARLVKIFEGLLDAKHYPSPYVWGALLGLAPSAVDRFFLDVVLKDYNTVKTGCM